MTIVREVFRGSGAITCISRPGVFDGIVGRVVIVRNDDGLARLADADSTVRPEIASIHQYGAFVVKDLAACTTMVLSTESGELLAAVEAVLCIFISHPEFFAQELTAELVHRSCLAGLCCSIFVDVLFYFAGDALR
jgi:hypothetical protein